MILFRAQVKPLNVVYNSIKRIKDLPTLDASTKAAALNLERAYIFKFQNIALDVISVYDSLLEFINIKCKDTNFKNNTDCKNFTILLNFFFIDLNKILFNKEYFSDYALLTLLTKTLTSKMSVVQNDIKNLRKYLRTYAINAKMIVNTVFETTQTIDETGKTNSTIIQKTPKISTVRVNDSWVSLKREFKYLNTTSTYIDSRKLGDAKKLNKELLQYFKEFYTRNKNYIVKVKLND
jgi:hypothetical protein